MQLSPFHTEPDRATKREAVLLAAVRMFNERGFNATSLEDVAASLGVTKPVIYRYLGNKDQVLLECVTRGLAQLQAAADAVCRERGTGLDRLQAFLRRYAEINMGDFGRCTILTSNAALSPDSAAQFRDLKRRVDAAMRALIEEGRADGSLAVADVKLTAFALAGALNAPAYWYRPDGVLPADTLAAGLVAALTAGLQPPKG